jgi:maleate isomerase
MLTPSSNTVLEPTTTAMLGALPTITAHFARLRVTEIAVSETASAQFDADTMLGAGALLADARPRAIIWNGTSGGWLGLDADRRIADALASAFAIPASTVTLALVDLLRRTGAERISFVTPYTDDIQVRIIRTFEAAGFQSAVSPCLGISENFAFSAVTVGAMDLLIEKAAADKPDVIVPFCTNLPAAPHVARWEAELGIPVFDSVAIATWSALKLAGISPSVVLGWGSLFAV